MRSIGRSSHPVILEADLLRLEVGDKRRVGISKCDDYGFGVALGSFGAGVGVVDGKAESGFFRAKGLEAVGFDGGHVDERDLLGGCELGLVLAVAHVAFDVEVAVGVVDPDVADGDGEEDWCGFLGASVGDVFTDIPAVAVDGLGSLTGEGPSGEGFRKSIFGGLVANSFVAGAGLGVVFWGDGATVVVTHLDEDIVAGLHLGEDCGPAAFVVVTAGAAASDCAIGDVDFGDVEVVGEVVTPAKVGLVAGGGVADDEEGG